MAVFPSRPGGPPLTCERPALDPKSLPITALFILYGYLTTGEEGIPLRSAHPLSAGPGGRDVLGWLAASCIGRACA